MWVKLAATWIIVYRDDEMEMENKFADCAKWARGTPEPRRAKRSRRVQDISTQLDKSAREQYVLRQVGSFPLAQRNTLQWFSQLVRSARRRSNSVEVKPKWSLWTEETHEGNLKRISGRRIPGGAPLELRIRLLAWHIKRDERVQQMQFLSKIVELSQALQLQAGGKRLQRWVRENQAKALSLQVSLESDWLIQAGRLSWWKRARQEIVRQPADVF